ncbi:LytR/AlgR family response regulator transcription factor [Desulfovulcanus sp.]
MLSLTLDLLQRTFKVGIVVYDENYNIVCVNKIIQEFFHFDFERSDTSYNLSNLHSQKVFSQIKEMTEEAIRHTRSGGYIIKIYQEAHKKNLIFLIKVFLLHGQCRDIFIALLYNVTDILMDEKKIIKFPVYDGSNFLLLDVPEIDFFKATGNQTEIFYHEKKYLSPLSLGKIEKKLDSKDFIRVHKSFIVNINKIEKLEKDKNKYQILMKNDYYIPISRTKANIVLNLFGLK